MRKGSWTSSTVSVGSATLMARVDSPTGPPPKRRHRASSTARSVLSRPRSSTAKTSSPAWAAARSTVPGAPDVGVVAHPAQQAVGDAGRAPGPPGDLAGAGGVDVDLEDLGRPHHDGLEVLGLVEVEAGDEAEAVAQRTGDQPGAGGGADEGEAGDVDADGAGGRALAQHDVDHEVLHGRVQHFLDGTRQAVDLVDEEHVALGQLAEDGGQVTGPLQGRSRGHVQGHVDLGGHDPGQGGVVADEVTDRVALVLGDHDAAALDETGVVDQVDRVRQQGLLEAVATGRPVLEPLGLVADDRDGLGEPGDVVLARDRQPPRGVGATLVAAPLALDPGLDAEPEEEVLDVEEEVAVDAVELHHCVPSVAPAPADGAVACEVGGQELADHPTIGREHHRGHSLVVGGVTPEVERFEPAGRAREAHVHAVGAVRPTMVGEAELVEAALDVDDRRQVTVGDVAVALDRAVPDDVAREPSLLGRQRGPALGLRATDVGQDITEPEVGRLGPAVGREEGVVVRSHDGSAGRGDELEARQLALVVDCEDRSWPPTVGDDLVAHDDVADPLPGAVGHQHQRVDGHRLAQAGGAGEEEVVGGLAPAAGRLQDDGQVLLELGLAHEVGQRAGPQAGLGRLLPAQGRGVEDAVGPARPVVGHRAEVDLVPHRSVPRGGAARRRTGLIGGPPCGGGPR